MSGAISWRRDLRISSFISPTGYSSILKRSSAKRRIPIRREAAIVASPLLEHLRRLTRVCSGRGAVRWQVPVSFRCLGFGAWRHRAAETQERWAALMISRAKSFVVSAVLIAAAFFGGMLFTDFRHDSRIGILVFGGARYWVSLASTAVTPEEAKMYLQRVLRSSEYGVNAADNAVASLGSPAVRRRLYLFLAEIAPNDNWRKIYRARAATISAAPPNSALERTSARRAASLS